MNFVNELMDKMTVTLNGLKETDNAKALYIMNRFMDVCQDYQAVYNCNYKLNPSLDEFDDTYEAGENNMIEAFISNVYDIMKDVAETTCV